MTDGTLWPTISRPHFVAQQATTQSVSTTPEHIKYSETKAEELSWVFLL